jgi:hypothetical protein
VVWNVDAAESEIERTTAARLREVYRLPLGHKDDRRQEEEATALADAGERPDEVWRAVAWILLAVLVVEMFVANRTHSS